MKIYWRCSEVQGICGDQWRFGRYLVRFAEIHGDLAEMYLRYIGDVVRHGDL